MIAPTKVNKNIVKQSHIIISALGVQSKISQKVIYLNDRSFENILVHLIFILFKICIMQFIL